MDIISFMEDQAVIRKILAHLDLWTVQSALPQAPSSKIWMTTTSPLDM
jgi:hypothetical protein